jgi:hypothetical protein
MALVYPPSGFILSAGGTHSASQAYDDGSGYLYYITDSLNNRNLVLFFPPFRITIGVWYPLSFRIERSL